MQTGSYVPLNPATMRNRWFPARVADYVPFKQLKLLKAQEVDMQRDTAFGVRVALEEVEDEEEDLLAPRKPYVRPIEIEVLSVSSAYLLEREVANRNSPNDLWNFSTPSSHLQSTSRDSALSRRRRLSHDMARLARLMCLQLLL